MLAYETLLWLICYSVDSRSELGDRPSQPILLRPLPEREPGMSEVKAYEVVKLRAVKRKTWFFTWFEAVKSDVLGHEIHIRTQSPIRAVYVNEQKFAPTKPNKEIEK